MMKKIFTGFAMIFSLMTILFNQTGCGNSNSTSAGKDISSKSGIIAEKIYLDLGGEKQYVEILTKSKRNPVLLFVHGGPGWPQTPQLRYFNSALTDAFTLVIWEQRGSGNSFINSPAPANMTLEQIVSDAYELTQILKEKFKKKKIYLAGYSWGSIVGMNLALKYPDDYLAYIGISQVINMRIGMVISQSWIMERASEKSDTADLNTLKRLQAGDNSLCEGDLNCFMKQYELLLKYNGVIFNKASEKEIEKAIQNAEDYRLYDWNKAFEYSAKYLENDMFSANFTSVKELKLPVYFLEGRHDWNVPAVLTESFYEKLQAPHKEIFWFEKSGHSPLEEEPETFNNIMINKIIR